MYLKFRVVGQGGKIRVDPSCVVHFTITHHSSLITHHSSLITHPPLTPTLPQFWQGFNCSAVLVSLEYRPLRPNVLERRSGYQEFQWDGVYQRLRCPLHDLIFSPPFLLRTLLVEVDPPSHKSSAQEFRFLVWLEGKGTFHCFHRIFELWIGHRGRVWSEHSERDWHCFLCERTVAPWHFHAVPRANGRQNI